MPALVIVSTSRDDVNYVARLSKSAMNIAISTTGSIGQRRGCAPGGALSAPRARRVCAGNGESWCAQVIEKAGLPMTKPTFSHHLRILREAGIVTKRIQGTKGYMSLRKADLDCRFPGLLDSVISADLHSVISADTEPVA